MPLFGRKSRSQSRLLTAVISARQRDWEVFWIGDGGKEPRSFRAAGLTDAADQATEAAVALDAAGPPLLNAELQFVIYPWDYGDNAPIYDISGAQGEFMARDIQGSEREITGSSLEELVAALGGEPAGSQAMLRWVRPFAALPTAG